MDTQRIIALIVFSFSGLLLWEAWQKHTRPPMPVRAEAQSVAAAATSTGTIPPATQGSAPKASADASAVPTPSSPLAPPAPANQSSALTPGQGPLEQGGQKVSVKTDALQVELSTLGGDIRSLTLRNHFARGDTTRAFTVMQDKVGHYFIAQSGLLGEGLPNHTATWKTAQTNYELGSAEKLEVVFSHQEQPGISVNKVYTFKRGSYLIDVRYEVVNNSAAPLSPAAYFQFLRDSNPPEGESTGNVFTGVVTFTGPAVYTDAKKFQKVAFSDIDKNKAEHAKEATDGWLAMVQHYFVSAWLPQGTGKREYFTKKVSSTLYSSGVIQPLPAIAPGGSSTLSMPLYVGPQEQENLKKLAPGLDLVVDYGWLTVLAYPMFVVLSFINNIVGNWGWTIIIFTILLKLVFFPLNQKAGKSMAHMKTVAPKMEALRARYGDDKTKLNQAMMDLYRTEKINPLGGCLPMLVQIPFFIALYWVLLGAVELRNAPWLGWITDLSTPDPYYVLPLLMGVSMIVQTKLQPAPPDPVQAKVMMILPVVFSIMFFFFPSGLVLYWTAQNILTIGQQWYINKTFSAPVTAAKR